MSARLNMNEIPIISWKGQTFNQITSFIAKNANIDPSINTKAHMFLPSALKIYRREIASKVNTLCSNFASSIDEINMPNGSLNNTSTNGQSKGLVNTLDIKLTTNTTERSGLCKECKDPEASNALRRLRSSGNVKRQFDLTTNNATYYTDRNQYLVSRNKTFQQNQYNYIRQGDATMKPGDSLSISNVYSPNGTSNCKEPTCYINTDCSFAYQWIDGTYNTVTIPKGNYDTNDINQLFKNTMINNTHCYIKNDSNSNVFLLNIAYNSTYNKIELQSFVTNSLHMFQSQQYRVPMKYDVNNNVSYSSWYQTDNSINVVPLFIINNSKFKDVIGFAAGNYPSTIISINSINYYSPSNPDQYFPRLNNPIIVYNTIQGNNLVANYSTNQVSLSSTTPLIQSRYKVLYYKPNNYQFAQQGAVSASSLITRVKYNSITNSTVGYKNAYGTSVANALAYGVSDTGYTIKDKIGYPNKCTPTFTNDKKSNSDCYITRM